MKTRYTDYRDYLLSIGEDNIVTCFERYNEISSEYVWNRLEEVIGLLSYEDAYCYLTSYGSDEWRDSAHHDFQYEIDKMTEYWPGLKDNLIGWIKNIKYTNKDVRLQKLISESARFLSFNYTNTLEVLYDVPKDKITYIHGDASKSDELVLGHRSDDWYPEWDRTNPDEDVRLLEASEIMDRHFENTKKRIEEIIERHKAFFETCCEYDEIYVLGLSYNDTDIMYLQEIAINNDKAEWNFNWYSMEDLKSIDHYASRLGVQAYKKINIDEW
jgi:hypothetical protein